MWELSRHILNRVDSLDWAWNNLGLLKFFSLLICRRVRSCASVSVSLDGFWFGS